LFLTGEAGIGKSALAEEFIRSARRSHPDMCIATGRAVEQYGTGEAYLPFLDALTGLLRDRKDFLWPILRANAPTWCLQFPTFSSGAELDQLRHETSGATKDRMLREMGDAFATLSTTAPFLLLLEDLHWADPSTVDLLRSLCSRVCSQRVLLVATFRPENLETENRSLRDCVVEVRASQYADESRLDVLGVEDISNLLDLRFRPNDFPRDFARLIWRRTDGQPLFTVSLLEFLAGRGDIVKTFSEWTLARPPADMDLEIPDSIRAMIRKKIEALDANSRLALQYASVEGEEFLSTVTAALLECDQLKLEEQMIDLERRHGLIRVRAEEELPDGVLAVRYAFAHALYQNVSYEDVASRRRTLLHCRAGEELLLHYGDSAPRISVQLAMHFERGRNWSSAIEFLVIAGDNATSVHANTQAEEHYTRALGLAAKLPPDCRANTELRIYRKRAAVYLAMSRFDASVFDCRQMIERARDIGSVDLECLALYSLGNTLFWAHRLYEMESVLQEVLRLADRTNSDAARRQALALLAQGHLALGDLDQADHEFQQVNEQAPLIDRRTLLGILDVKGRLRFFRSEYVAAQKMFRETMNLASELGDSFELLKSHYFLTLTLANLGRISEALEVLERFMEIARRNSDSFWSSRVPNCLGWIHRELQNFESAAAFDTDGAETARRLRVGEAEVNSVINLAFDHFHTGDDQGAHSAMESAKSMLSNDPWFSWRFEIRLLAARAEQTFSRADALCLVQKATQCGARKYIIVAHTLLARIAMAKGEPEIAEAELKAAVGILREFPAPLAAWKTFSTLGQLQAQRGATDAANAAFEKAASIIDDLANNIADQHLRTVFLNSSAVQASLR
jgi:tetratricopeptide (TPR) repeat protein